MNLFSKILNLRQCSANNTRFYYQTFTYYVPAPPPRKSGYQERKFDNICTHILSLGLIIDECKIIPHTSPSQSGFWIFFILKSLDKRALLDASSFPFIESESESEDSLIKEIEDVE